MNATRIIRSTGSPSLLWHLADCSPLQLRATRYLENLTRCGRASCDDSANAIQPSRPQPPYINFGSVQEPSSWIHSACRGAACVINTNIRMLPDEISHSAENVSDIFVLEAKNIAALSEHEKTNYLQRPLSNAVDMKPDTIFRSMTRTVLVTFY